MGDKSIKRINGFRWLFIGLTGDFLQMNCSAGKLAKLRFYYIMDIESGITVYLNKDKMLEIISSYPDLLEKYNAEQHPEEIETLKKYVMYYKELTNIKQKVGLIPEIKSIEEGHRLTNDQENGITYMRALEIVDEIIRRQHKAN